MNKTGIKTEKIESQENPAFMKKNEVVGYPTFLLTSASGSKIKEYNGKRKADDLLKFCEANK